MTQIACRVSLPKCQIPNSFNKTVLIRNSAALVVFFQTAQMTYVLIYLTRTSAGTCLSEAHRGGEGDKGKHDTETLVSHQNRPTGPLLRLS